MSAAGEGAASAPHDERETEGAQIGRYRLLQKIGEGGFGVVWMAEQREPVVREVALKILKLGMDTKQVVVRFEAERQALALMEHPSIAKVFDGGATASGRPYFVMELVRGSPITQYCDDARLTTKERLELFVQVCHAVQHAHQKGVIHRDIKPSNVMVALHDGVPVPKVIDFGIAKATSVRLTDKTMFTEIRQMIGTPEYMAPEQAEMSSLDVDTRADVYSLGVLLYELVTGTKPFELRTVMERGYEEILRTIREVDPPKPSTRISTLGDELNVVAARRRTDARQLGRVLRGDLDWIVMRALEKDRTRRYQSVGELAADVRRHLADENVLATPPSAFYRARKYVRRHKVGVAASAAVLVTLVAGLIAAVGGWREALHQSDVALAQGEIARARAQEALEQQRVAETARTAEQAQRQRAELGEQQARASEARAKAVADLLQSALAAADPYKSKGKDYTVRELLDGIDAEIGARLAEDPEAELALRMTLGASYRGLAVYDTAERHLTRAVELAQQKYQGDHAELATLRSNLAAVLATRGRFDEARTHAHGALEMQQRLGARADQVTTMTVLTMIARETGDPVAAERILRDARARIDELGGEHPQLETVLQGIAVLTVQRGDYAGAEPLLRDVIERMRRNHSGDHPDLALVLANAGSAYLNVGKAEESERVLRESLAMMRRLYSGPHLDLSTCLNNFGTLLFDRNRIDEAAQAFAEALEMLRALKVEDDFAESQIANNLGAIAWERGDYAEAAARSADALAVYLRRHPPEDPSAILMRANVLKAYARVNQPALAEPLARTQVDACRKAYGDEHDQTIAAKDTLFEVLCALAWDIRDLESGREAEELARELLAQIESKMGATALATVEAREALARALIARVRASTTDPTREAALGEARELLDRCWSDSAQLKNVRSKTARSLARLYVLWNELAPDSEKQALAEEWRAQYESLGGKKP